MISGLHSALSGLQGFMTKVASAANNTANINTDGYKKTRVTLEEREPQGVTANVEAVTTPGPEVYELTGEGRTMVEKSNVELHEEIPNLLIGKRFYQANLKTVQVADEMLGNLLDIKG